MNYITKLDSDPANRVNIKIKSGEDYPYGDIVLIEFTKEASRFKDGYSTGGRDQTVRVNLTRESVLNFIKVLKLAADEATTHEIIDK